MKLRIIATAALTTALLSTGAVAASAAPVSSAETSDCQFGEHLLSAWLKLPADLRGDLAELKGLDRAERATAARTIREAALDGEYGPGVQTGVAKLRAHRLDVISDLPAELKADLRELRAAEQPDRLELAQEIAQTALDGGYGEKAQSTAERIQASDAWQNCVAD